MRTAPLLHLSFPFTCVCSTGTKFGTDENSIDVYDHGLSYLSISIFTSYAHLISLRGDRAKDSFVTFERVDRIQLARKSSWLDVIVFHITEFKRKAML